jgi:hypothetical protein
MAASYAGSPLRRSAGRLDAAPATRDLPILKSQGDPMGWYAIILIVGFVVATGVLNRIEFGRFD